VDADNTMVAGRDIPAGSAAGVRADGRSGSQHHGASLPESVNEALFLFITAGLGLVLNVVVIMCILASRRQRRVTNSFVIHGCALDAIKCAYCVPFATSLLRDVAPGFCAVLGGSVIFFSVFGSRIEIILYVQSGRHLSEQVSCLGVPVNTFFVVLCFHAYCWLFFIYCLFVYFAFTCVVKYILFYLIFIHMTVFECTLKVCRRTYTTLSPVHTECIAWR